MAGALIFGAGLHEIAGPAWLAIFWGALLMLVPVVRAMRQGRATKGEAE